MVPALSSAAVAETAASRAAEGRCAARPGWGPDGLEVRWPTACRGVGHRSASRTRAILIQGQSLELSKRTGASFVCTTGGLDEKDFWLLAHEP